MPDPRIEQYAKLLIERCLDVQPGWQVLIRTTPLARPLLDELERQIGRRGAYAVVRMNWTLWPIDYDWAPDAPEHLVGELPEIDRFACDHMDARITIDAPENTREGVDLSHDRRRLAREAEAYFYRRSTSGEIRWVSCQFPTHALAQEAEMTLRELEDFLYRACLVEWDELAETMRRRAQRFGEAHELRIVGRGTDLTLSLEGRRFEVDDGHTNMPGGELYCAPVEDSADGVIEFSDFPSVYDGHELEGIRLVFREGSVVEASAVQGDSVLHSVLDRDEGARRLGELGIGCNPGITRFMKNTLFDEKIDGTVHLALGQSYTSLGGRNMSSVHWDIVKDLRSRGHLEIDGEVVQEGGVWAV